MAERKVFPFELVKVDTQGRTFEGYASTFGNTDLGGDVVQKGAFKKTLAARGHKVKLLWQHNPAEPIGRPMELREDDHGLFIRGLISDTTRGRDCLALLKDKAIDSMSIGYDAVDAEVIYPKDRDKPPTRQLKEIRLWEVSLVSFPMNEAAQVTAVKGALPFVATEKADEGESWDGPGVMAACEGKEQLRRACAWVDPDGDPEAKSSYKLPHHTPDGKVVWKGVAAAMQRLGGTDIPEADRPGVRSHLARHYAQFDKPLPGEEPKATVPPASPALPVDEVKAALDASIESALSVLALDWSAAQLITRAGQLKRGERLSRASRNALRQAAAAISALLSGYDDEDKPEPEDQDACRKPRDDEDHKSITQPADPTETEPDVALPADTEASRPTDESAPTLEVKAEPVATPPTSDESPDPDPFAEFDSELARIAALLTKEVA